jgi:rSAM/selenodomain-associated transferase 1
MKSNDQCLLFFMKSPEKGNVKSRLAASIGKKEAAALYKTFTLDMLAMLKKGDFPFRLYFYPEHSLESLRAWLGNNYDYFPQRGRNLGQRMKNGFHDAFASGFRKVVLVGSDIPDLPLGFIREAFIALQKNEAVVGPSYDGGYYLIGFRDAGFSPEVFEGIPWSTEKVLAKTIKLLGSKKFHLLPKWRDIDTVEDLKKSNWISKK